MFSLKTLALLKSLMCGSIGKALLGNISNDGVINIAGSIMNLANVDDRTKDSAIKILTSLQPEGGWAKILTNEEFWNSLINLLCETEKFLDEGDDNEKDFKL